MKNLWADLVLSVGSLSHVFLQSWKFFLFEKSSLATSEVLMGNTLPWSYSSFPSLLICDGYRLKLVLSFQWSQTSGFFHSVLSKTLKFYFYFILIIFMETYSSFLDTYIVDFLLPLSLSPLPCFHIFVTPHSLTTSLLKYR